MSKEVDAFHTEGYGTEVVDIGLFLQDLMDRLGLKAVAQLDEYENVIGYKFYKKEQD